MNNYESVTLDISIYKSFFLSPSLSRPRVYRECQSNTWEELYCVQTDMCDRSKNCQVGCPTYRVKVQRFRHSTRGGFRDTKPFSSRLQKPPVAGFAIMGGRQPSKDENGDRDPEGNRTCHRLVHCLKEIYREITVS